MFYFGFRLAKASLILLLTLGFQNMSSQGENYFDGVTTIIDAMTLYKLKPGTLFL